MPSQVAIAANSPTEDSLMRDDNQTQMSDSLKPMKPAMKRASSSAQMMSKCDSLSPRKRKLRELKKQSTADNLKALRAVSQETLKNALESVERQQEQAERPHKRRRLSQESLMSTGTSNASTESFMLSPVSSPATSPNAAAGKGRFLFNCKSVKSIPQLPLQEVESKKKAPTTVKPKKRVFKKSRSKKRLSLKKRLSRRGSLTAPTISSMNKTRETSSRRSSISSNASMSSRKSTSARSSKMSNPFQIPKTPRRKFKGKANKMEPKISPRTVPESPQATMYTPRSPAPFTSRVSHNKKKNASFGSKAKRMSYFDQTPVSPPSTTYSPRLSFTKPSHQKKSAPFGTGSDRMTFQEDIADTPGPQHYSPKHQADSVSHNKGDMVIQSTGQRMTFQMDLAQTPGPLHYSPKNNAGPSSHHKGDVCFTGERIAFQKDLAQTPGPQHYSPKHQADSVSHNKGSMAIQSTGERMTFQKDLAQTPGPFHYSPKSNTGPSSHHKGDVCFTGERIVFQKDFAQTPGPQYYSPKQQADSVSHNKGSMVFQSSGERMTFQMDLAKTPGPNYYSPVNPAFTTSFVNPLMLSSTRFSHIPNCQSTVNTHSYIRPDCYSSFDLSQSQAVALGNQLDKSSFLTSSERFEEIEVTPGPGHYCDNYVDLSFIEKKYVDKKNENFHEDLNTTLPLEISFLKMNLDH